MKLEDCKVGMKVKVLGKSIHIIDSTFPAFKRGWGYISNRRPINGEDTVYLKKEIGGPTENGGYSPADLEPYEPEETEYRQLKDITPRAIFDVENASVHRTPSDYFMQGFTRFVNDFDLAYDESLGFENLELELITEPEWANWLIQHGFIEKVVKEVTYAQGDRLVNDEGGKAEIVQTNPSVACIICNSNRWVDPISVSDVTSITAEEFKKMNGDTGTWRKDK